jgi:hypothetical protein
MKKSMKTLLLAIGALMVTSANAGVVDVWGERYNLNVINDFYNGLTGTSSSIVAGQLDTINLSGVNLLWAVQPADAYTNAELNAMASFLSGGGRIAFMGEHGQFAPQENDRINTALSFLGSTISIVPGAIVDPGFRTASVGDGQIHAHPLTTGVNTYQYAAFDPLLVSGTAQVLMTGEDDTTAIMMAFQNIGPGSIFLITDQNVWDGSPTWPGGFNNGRMFENLLSGDTGAPPVGGVPEPGSLALLAVSVVSLVVLRRRRM